MPVNYDELARRVPLWLFAENRNLVDEMPVIVEQAEDWLLQILDHDLYQSTLATFTVDETNAQIDLNNLDPRVLEVRAVRLQYREAGWTPLLPRDLEAMSMLYAQARPARPRYWSTSDRFLNLELFPNPNTEYTVEITANVEYERLGPTTQTNVLTEQFPRMIERACLYMGAYFQKNFEDAAAYKTEASDAAAEANAQIARRRRDNTESRPLAIENMRG